MTTPSSPPRDTAVAQRFRRARRDEGLAVLEGFHALKHALRFGAAVREVVATDLDELARLAGELAPDQRDAIATLARPIDPAVFAALAPHAPPTGVMALALRPAVDVVAVLADPRPAPVVLLEDPRNLANTGACVRVAAGADAAAVLTTGIHDPWSPDALRGAAGLHFALPVARVGAAPEPGDHGRPLLAIDPDGDPLDPATVDPRAILAFGTERDGLSDALLARADGRVRIPMRPGVSSLNLATAVAAVLYAGRLGGGWPALGA